MFQRLAARLGPTVRVTVSRDAFTFATDRDEVTIESAVRVDDSGRIRGFGTANRSNNERTIALFQLSGSGILSANDRALIAICQRGFSEALQRRIALRPRVELSVPPDMKSLTDVLVLALRRAGARSVALSTG